MKWRMGGSRQSETSNQIICCASWSRDICARPFHIWERKSHTINVTGLILVSNFKRLFHAETVMLSIECEGYYILVCSYLRKAMIVSNIFLIVCLFVLLRQYTEKEITEQTTKHQFGFM